MNSSTFSGMSYEQILSLAHSHVWSPKRDEAQAYVQQTKTKLAHSLIHALALYSTSIGDLRELGTAVHDVLHTLGCLEADPDTRSSTVIGVLVRYGHYDPTADEIELLVKISEAP